MERHILHFHIPCFQISLERVLDPKLRYRPVVVAVPPEGGIISCSFEAKKEGIRPAMSIKEAKRLCPRLTIICPDPFKVEKAIQRLSLHAQRYSPVWEISKAGHLYLDLTGTHRLWDRKDVGKRLMGEVKEDLGVSGSTGIAPNKLISQIASRIIPPPEILEVKQGEESHFMAPLDVALLPAIYPNEAESLKADFGLNKIELLWKLDLSLLKLLFASRAATVYEQSRGIDPTPVYPQAMTPKIEERILLPKAENKDETLRSYLFVLLETCFDKIHALKLLPKKAGLWIRYSDYVFVMRSFSPKGFHLWELFGELERLFEKAFTRKTGIRELGLWFHCHPKRLKTETIQQFLSGKTFSPSTAIEEAVREIRQRFGRDAINYGIALKARN